MQIEVYSMLPDFNRLKVFYHVYTERSSTGAARQLHITQSGVSQHLIKLEEELKTPLFTRVNRRLVPTAAGEKLYSIVKAFVLELEEGVRNIHEASEIPLGHLRIGAPPEFGRTYLPRIFTSFHRKYPSVSLEVELGNPNVLFSKLSEGSLDFGYIDILPFFTDTPGGTSAYSIEPVVREEFVLACSRSYYERNIRKTPDMASLVGLEYIGYKKESTLLQSWFLLHFNKAPQNLRVVLTVDSAQAIIEAIEKDLGLGLTVSHLMSRQIQEGIIVPVRITPKKLLNTIACVQFKKKAATLTEKVFQEHLLEELQQTSYLFT